MAIIIEAPNDVYSLENKKNLKLFLAGGISNCPDWQSEVIKELRDVRGLTIYNPRRADFPMHIPEASEEQITWEYYKLKEADIICFWFSRGSLNPIVLYELGRWGNSSDKPIIVGLDPEYERIHDVLIQTKLSRPKVELVYSLTELCEEVKIHLYR
jgi:hypothetical protein